MPQFYHPPPILGGAGGGKVLPSPFSLLNLSNFSRPRNHGGLTAISIRFEITPLIVAVTEMTAGTTFPG